MRALFKLYQDSHHVKLAGLWLLIIISQRMWKNWNMPFNRISMNMHSPYSFIRSRLCPQSYDLLICTRTRLSTTIQSVGFKWNNGSFQMVWYPAWLLFLPIRYATRTIRTSPARAAPTMMGMSIWSRSIWHSSAGHKKTKGMNRTDAKVKLYCTVDFISVIQIILVLFRLSVSTQLEKTTQPVWAF